MPKVLRHFSLATILKKTLNLLQELIFIKGLFWCNQPSSEIRITAVSYFKSKSWIPGCYHSQKFHTTDTCTNVIQTEKNLCTIYHLHNLNPYLNLYGWQDTCSMVEYISNTAEKINNLYNFTYGTDTPLNLRLKYVRPKAHILSP